MLLRRATVTIIFRAVVNNINNCVVVMSYTERRPLTLLFLIR